MKTKLINVDYMGFTAMDRRFSSSMLPWVLTEIKRRSNKDRLCLCVDNGNLQAFDVNFELQFSHKLHNIMRFTQVNKNPKEFLYLLKDNKEALLYCYLFQATSPEDVSELFGQMKELAPHGGGGSLQHLNSEGNTTPKHIGTPPPGIVIQRTPVSTNRGFQSARQQQQAIESQLMLNSASLSQSKSYNAGLNRSGSSVGSDISNGHPQLVRSVSNAASLTSLCADISTCNSHFFEVLYVGKIKVSHKKVPESLIDDALNKFRQFEVDKMKSAQMRRNSLLSTKSDSMGSEQGSTESLTSAPNVSPLVINKELANIKAYEGLNSPSLTPLNNNRKFFPDKSEETEEYLEKEFDSFSSERVGKQSTKDESSVFKKPFPVALEPNVLIINRNKNLTTLPEDDESSKDDFDNNNLPKNVTKSGILKNGNDPIKKKVNINESLNNYSENDKTHLPTSPSHQQNLHFKDLSSSDGNLLRERDESVTTSNELKGKELLNDESLPENKNFARDRSASIGTLNLNKTPIAQLIGDQNRTMLFQVGRMDLRLISPDRKQILLHRQLRDVASCVQGVTNPDHFGFICREPSVECFVGYVFKCESDSVASEVVGAISQAFVAHAEIVKQGKERSPILSCEHCPMVWYHKLCQDLEGLNEKRVHSTILRRIEQLPEEEQIQIVTKYEGGTEDLYEIGEHNAFLMMLLRAHCEAKQQRHVHDTAENRSEFLNQYLGGGTIFTKAKRSLSISFDHLLKRKATKEDLGPLPIKDIMKKDVSPTISQTNPMKDSNNSINHENRVKNSPDLLKEPGPNTGSDASIQSSLSQSRDFREQSPTNSQLKSPMMDIFMKLGSNSSSKGHDNYNNNGENGDMSADEENAKSDHQGSWRQAIFNRINQKLDIEGNEDLNDGNEYTLGTNLLRRPSSFTNLQAQGKRTKEDLKKLWKNAIHQAIILIRMEKENARLKAKQEVSAVKRIKLEYDDIGRCGNENSKVWELLTGPRESRISTKVDSQMLFQAIRHGVPRAKRGEVWYFLAEQFCLKMPPPDTKNFPNYGAPYETLLKQLTSHQHAILIDLGRTFPGHTYFSSPMGPGQLALFNLLKAYSLLDPEVGYCQGLSFVAGVLLLHLEEAEAFLMLRHLMFRRGLRKQYLPDMIDLQIKLYQLSRLLKDNIPELYEKFDEYDVSPTLYAAPWLLTVFTSQFPLGFVTRVFDLLFLESSEVIFRVAIALLDIHKDGLMVCDSFEEIMEYLKHVMPNIDKPMLDKVIKLAFSLDFGRQLHEYQVEYNVLQEEMAEIAPKLEMLNKIESEKNKLESHNHHLADQLEEAMGKISTLQATQGNLEFQIKGLEKSVALLARYVGTHYDKKKDSDLPADIKKLCQQVQQNDRKTLGVFSQKFGQSFSSKFSTNDFDESNSDQDEMKNDKSKKLLKPGLSSPNLFNKIPVEKKEEVEKKVEKIDPEMIKKRQYLQLKKSYSCNAGLVANQKPEVTENRDSTVNKIVSNLKAYPLKVLDETPENETNNNISDFMNEDKLSNASTLSISSNKSFFSDILSPQCDSPKQKLKFFAQSHEQIRQEKLQAEQMKRDFEENLKRLDARLSPKNMTYQNDNEFQKSQSCNPFLSPSKTFDFERSNMDSGIGTPVSPCEKTITPKGETASSEEHPLGGCDLNIKFDVHSTKLKTLKPSKTNKIT